MTTGADKRRDDGIDMLRALSMFMVVCMHVLSQGGVMVRYSDNHLTYDVCWLLESAFFCAVNCYGLISGWVGIKASWKPGRFLELWLNVLFYTVGITAFSALTGLFPVTRDTWVSSLLPVTWKTYWYFSAYAALFFLMPFLNAMVCALSLEQCRMLMLVLFAVFSMGTTVPKVFSVDFLELIGGYSLIWLIVLYVFGACLRRIAETHRKRKRRTYLLLYAANVLAAWLFKIICEKITRSLYGEARYARALLTYTAPTIFLAGVCLVMAFAGIRLKRRAGRIVVRILASTCFSVYVIHAHPLFWNGMLKGAFSSFARLAPGSMLIRVLGAGAAIYLLCTFADLLRLALFQKLHVRSFCDALAQKIAGYINVNIHGLAGKEGSNKAEDAENAP